MVLGHPAAVPETVVGAVKLPLALYVRLPFLMSPAWIVVGVVVGPTFTLFCPGDALPPWFVQV